jgi:outer membrane protein
MLKKIPNPLFLFSLFFSLILLLIISFLIIEKDKVVFVDNVKIFNDFRMTKELVRNGDKELLQKKQKLDSLYMYLNIIKDQDTKAKLVQEVIKQKQLIEHFEANYSASNSEKIWKRINGYVHDYAQQKDYDLIQGTQSANTIFYGNSDLDVTNEVLVYINKRYEGFN